MTRNVPGLAAVGLLGAIAVAWPAHAAGSYDGTWVVDVPAADFLAPTSNYRCPALRLPIQIRDNRIAGRLQRVSSTTGAVIVEAGNGRISAPVTGIVMPDGTVTAQWQNYHATGKLGPQVGQVTIQGECGPRTATALRITSAGNATAGEGSSQPYPTEPLQGR